MMVILAVDVIRDRTTECYKLCTGHNRQEPAPRYDESQNFTECYSRIAAQGSDIRVEGDKAIQLMRGELNAITVDTAIAVTSPCSVGKQWGAVTALRQVLKPPVPGFYSRWAGNRNSTPALGDQRASHRTTAATTMVM